MAESVTVGELLVRIKADIRDLEAGLRKAQLGVNGFSTNGASRIRRLENAFRILGLQAVGLTGPLGRVASVISSFGGARATAVLGVLGAIGIAWKIIADRAKEAREEMQNNLTTIRALATTRALRAAGLVREVEGGPSLRRQLEANIKLFQATLQSLEPLSGILGRAVTQRGKDLEQSIREMQTALRDFGGTNQQEFQAAELAAREYFDRWEQWDAQARVWMRRNTITELLGDQKAALLEAESAAQAYFDRWAEFDRQARFAPFLLRGEEAIRDMLAALPRLQLDFEMREKWQEFGFALGDILSQGIEAAISKSLGGFLKGLLFTGLRGLLFGAINVATGGGFGAGFFAGAGIPRPPAGASKVAGVGIQGAIDFTNFPAASNPLASARDKDWQRFFRESGLVAASQGFRG